MSLEHRSFALSDQQLLVLNNHLKACYAAYLQACEDVPFPNIQVTFDFASAYDRRVSVSLEGEPQTLVLEDFAVRGFAAQNRQQQRRLR